METKFRAFQLDTPGSLFSFYKPDTYTLIEARIPKGGIEVLRRDIKAHGKDHIEVLHITSWDEDHCNYEDLIQILNNFRPAKIEIPHYTPDTETGLLCHKNIIGYHEIHKHYIPTVQIVSPQYIDTLPNASAKGLTDVVYKSKMDTTKKNDMSSIRLFRSAGCNVLSLGDCECSTIADSLTFTGSFVSTEVDVLILPHHGADNGFITAEFLDKVKPKIAICSSNYDNQYEHPKEEIKKLLHEKEIRLYTTKTGDVFVVHKKGEAISSVYNLISDNEKINSTYTFSPKRHK
ncbi:MAG TPA: hypothetical protein VNZ49_15300 [Bacteroidia bacterium]|jgi:competence protein ComEC|nr:hypothetical protein [Bacteroidia bacterium]